MTRIIVTRPSPDGERTRDLLIKEGFDALHLPLLTIAFHSSPLPPLAADTALAFTSVNGVRAWHAQNGDARNGDVDRPAFVVGERTAEAARQAGHPLLGVASGSVERMAEMMADLPKRPVLHVRGRDTAGDLTGTLQKQGWPITDIALYTAEAVPQWPEGFKTACEADDTVVTFFSPRTAQVFVDLVNRSPNELDISRLSAACLSENIANALNVLSFQNIHAAPVAKLGSFVDMLKGRCP